MDTNLKTFTAGKCPKCGGAAKDILYGMVANPPEDVILGGCLRQKGRDRYVLPLKRSSLH